MFYFGADIGQANDPTAICVVRVPDPEPPSNRRWPFRDLDPDPDSPPIFQVLHLERLPLGTSYPRVVNRIAQRMQAAPGDDHIVCIDHTGVGRPITDLLVQRGLHPIPITIRGANAVSRD